MNLFRYCADDPINHTDPTGLEKSSGDVWRDLMKFYSGNPSMKVVEAAWDDRRLRITMASMSSAKNGDVGSAKPYLGASVRVLHDESFDLSQDPIHLDTGSKANAKTSVHLGKPTTVVREDGMIRYTQTLTSKTTFPVPTTQAIVTAEMKRVAAVREHRNYLQSVAEVKSLRSFASAAEAQQVIGDAVSRAHVIGMDALKIKFDVFNSDGGTR